MFEEDLVFAEPFLEVVGCWKFERTWIPISDIQLGFEQDTHSGLVRYRRKLLNPGILFPTEIEPNPGRTLRLKPVGDQRDCINSILFQPDKPFAIH
jgi:hypothetical protein